jgi:hypothetical protein
MTRCKYYDCGYCYAPKDIKTNDDKGACIEPLFCPYLISQMTEKERIEGEIKILQKKLALIEELEKTKSPVEEAYKDAYGSYPITDSMSGGDIDYVSWDAFQKGYNAAYEEKVVEETKKQSVSLYQRFVNKGAYGMTSFENALKVVNDFLLDEGVIEDESGEYITFTLQKSLLDTPND